MATPPRATVAALMREFKRLSSRALPAEGGAPASQKEFEVSLLDESNLLKWSVEMSLPDDTPLGAELVQHSSATGAPPHMVLEVSFGHDFPTSPPFVRVVSPRLAFHTGHVTIGGSMCMELLTTKGWNSEYTVESALVMVRDAILSADPPGKLHPQLARVPYTEEEARRAFVRVATQHGWE